MPLYIREYEKLARERWGGPGVNIPAGKEPALAQQTPLAIGGISTASSAFNAETSLVLVHTSQACHVEFGTNPTATTNSHRMPADSTQFFGVTIGGGLKVAVIEA